MRIKQTARFCSYDRPTPASALLLRPRLAGRAYTTTNTWSPGPGSKPAASRDNKLRPRVNKQVSTTPPWLCVCVRVCGCVCAVHAGLGCVSVFMCVCVYAFVCASVRVGMRAFASASIRCVPSQRMSTCCSQCWLSCACKHRECTTFSLEEMQRHTVRTEKEK